MHRSPRTALAAASVLLALIAGMTTATATPAAAATSATVSGNVTTSNGTQIVATVTFYPVDGSGLPVTTTTSATGAYSVKVAPGRYHVRYSPQYQQTNSTTAWRGGSAVRSTSTILTVPSSGYSGDTQVLSTNSRSIYGAVRVGGAKPSGQVLVEVFRWNPATEEYERTPDRSTYAQDIGGSAFAYSLGGLAPGLLRMVFSAAAPLGAVRTETTSVVLDGPSPQSTELNINLQVRDITVSRLAGTNRFGTAAEISRASWDVIVHRPQSIFVVNGMNFPDALGAGPAAALKSAPILLVGPDSIPPETAEELSRLSTLTGAPLPIYVIGGPGTVSEAVVTQLKAYSPTVERVSGADRYATSRAVALRFWNDVSAVFLASGNNFPDALGGGPGAYRQGGPLVLVNGTAPRLDAATDELIGDVRTPTTLLGGTGAISPGIEVDLMAKGLPSVRRMAGADRYATGARIVDEYYASESSVYLANGANFPDALAGAAMAAGYDIPLLLVKQNCIPISVYNQLVTLRPNYITLLGGPGVLGPGVASLTRCAS